jgi:hypothetical protein
MLQGRLHPSVMHNATSPAYAKTHTYISSAGTGVVLLHTRTLPKSPLTLFLSSSISKEDTKELQD